MIYLDNKLWPISSTKSKRYPGVLAQVVSGMVSSVVSNRRQPNLYEPGGRGAFTKYYYRRNTVLFSGLESPSRETPIQMSRYHSRMLHKLSRTSFTSKHVPLLSPCIPQSSFDVPCVAFHPRQFYIGLSLAINNATGPDRRGELNGILMTTTSVARSLSPVCFSALFAYSIDGEHPFPLDYHLAFYCIGLIRPTVAYMGWNRIGDDSGAGGDKPMFGELRGARHTSENVRQDARYTYSAPSIANSA